MQPSSGQALTPTSQIPAAVEERTQPSCGQTLTCSYMCQRQTRQPLQMVNAITSHEGVLEYAINLYVTHSVTHPVTQVTHR